MRCENCGVVTSNIKHETVMGCELKICGECLAREGALINEIETLDGGCVIEGVELNLKKGGIKTSCL